MSKLQITSYGETYDITLAMGKYQENDNLAIQMMAEDKEYGCSTPYGIMTVNLSVKLPYNKAFVDTNNLPFIEDFIKENRLGKPTGVTRVSGFCTYPEYEFDLEELAKYE